jgi:hypothetical protein
MSKRAAQKAYAKAGVKPNDVQVIELHGKDTGGHFRSTKGHCLTRVAADKIIFKKNKDLCNSRGPIDSSKVSSQQCLFCVDCFSANELITYEALGLCDEGKAGEMVNRGDNTYGGKYVVNPSGGLISKGHPLGATGLAQCAEICWQLRNEAGKRQVPGARVGLQHNIGLGGACVVGIYRLAPFSK